MRRLLAALLVALAAGGADAAAAIWQDDPDACASVGGACVLGAVGVCNGTRLEVRRTGCQGRPVFYVDTRGRDDVRWRASGAAGACGDPGLVAETLTPRALQSVTVRYTCPGGGCGGAFGVALLGSDGCQTISQPRQLPPPPPPATPVLETQTWEAAGSALFVVTFPNATVCPHTRLDVECNTTGITWMVRTGSLSASTLQTWSTPGSLSLRAELPVPVPSNAEDLFVLAMFDGDAVCTSRLWAPPCRKVSYAAWCALRPAGQDTRCLRASAAKPGDTLLAGASSPDVVFTAGNTSWSAGTRAAPLEPLEPAIVCTAGCAPDAWAALAVEVAPPAPPPAAAPPPPADEACGPQVGEPTVPPNPLPFLENTRP